MAENGTNGTTTLSEKQLRALPYLVECPSISEGARIAQVGLRTLFRWLTDDEFQVELERRRSSVT